MNPRRAAVIGGGIAGLATARAILDADPNISLTIYEATDRAGGKVKTDLNPSAGAVPFVVEHGPNGFLNNQPHTIELARSLGLADRLLSSSDDARRRYVFLRGKLRKLPESPPAFLKSDLLSWRGKLRAARDWFIQKAPEGGVPGESVSEFTKRRLGPEILQSMVEPFVTGVFAGDAEKLELTSAFPRLQQMESEHGGLLRALVNMEKKRRRERRAPVVLYSFRSGMGELTGALEQSLQKSIRKNTPVDSLQFERGEFILTIGGARERADLVLLAVPAFDATKLLASLSMEAAAELQQIEYAPVVVAALRFPAAPAGADGFGFLTSRAEKLQILGALFETNIWPRADGGFLVRCMLGGTRAPELLRYSDDAIINIALDALAEAKIATGAPIFTKIIRWPSAIPQYHIGHAARLARIEASLAKYPNLHLAGAAYRGVSVNDLCRDAAAIAKKIAAAR